MYPTPRQNRVNRSSEQESFSPRMQKKKKKKKKGQGAEFAPEVCDYVMQDWLNSAGPVCSEGEGGRGASVSTCTVQGVLQLLQTLFAIMEQSSPSSYRNGLFSACRIGGLHFSLSLCLLFVSLSFSLSLLVLFVYF